MKCPQCGHWNKPSFPRCFKCGEPLNARAQLDPEWQRNFTVPPAKTKRVVYDDTKPPVQDLVEEAPQRNTDVPPEKLATEMSRLKDRRARGSVYLEEFRKRAAEQGIAPSHVSATQERGSFFADIPDDPAVTVLPVQADDPIREHTPFDTPLRGGRQAGSYNAARPEPAYNPYAYDPDLPPPLENPAQLPPLGKQKKRRRRVRGPMLLAYVLVGVLVVGIVAFAGYAVSTYVFPTLFSQRNAAVALEDYTLEQIDIDSLNGRRLKIPGEEGTQVYIGELMRTYVVVNGFATIEIADHVFYDTIDPLDKDMETMDVTLTPTLIRNGVETRVEPIRYTIDIPLSPIQLISPETQGVTVNASIINMRLSVAPNSRVMVNGRDESDTINDSGEVSFSQTIQAIGNNYIVITVRAPYSRENSLTVTVYRAPVEIPLELNPATLIESSTQQFTVYGTTQPGATITCETPYFSMNTNDTAETGEFSVATKMARVGYNTIRIIASYPGKADSILEHTVYYLPPASEYTPKAWALNTSDYTELMNNINLRIEYAQIYLCRGTIVKVLSSNPQLAIMDTGTDGKEQLVMLENRSRGDPWVLGQQYRVYADVSGVYNNIPRLVGRYTYAP